jgi:hypothetical protein
MLIFTNRMMSSIPDESAFGTSFREGSDRLGLAIVKRNAAGWNVSDIDHDVNDADTRNALEPLFGGSRPVLIYIHGNNNTPAKCFERCARLEALYDVELVGFSWPSEGYLADGQTLPGVDTDAEDGDEDDLADVDTGNRSKSRIKSKIFRYHQAKTNAQHSADALARFLRMVGSARLFANAQPFSLAAHSLGAHFFQHSLDLPGATEGISTAQNIALLAPCVRASGHRDWLARVKPKGQLFVTFNQGDNVLAGASVADNGLTGNTEVKLGTDPTPERLRVPYMRYISCTGAKVGGGGHGYFVQGKMPKRMQNVFGRILSSRRDLEPGEHERKIYGIKGDEDGLTFYFNSPV